VLGLDAKIAQIRTTERKIAGLLRRPAPGVPVRAVLALGGPGAPRLAAPVEREGVTIVNVMDRQQWAAFFTRGPHALSLEEARAPADALIALRDARITYELAHR
jgi:hypothetical protein